MLQWAPTTYNGTIGDLVIAVDGTFTYTPTADAYGQDTDSLKYSSNSINYYSTLNQWSTKLCYVGEIDASNQVSIVEPTAEFVGVSHTIVLGPEDEQNSQSVEQFIVTVFSDSADIISNNNVANDIISIAT